MSRQQQADTMRQEVTTLINTLNDTINSIGSQQDINDKQSSVVELLDQLQNLVSASIPYMPSREIKNAQERVSGLRSAWNERKLKFQPKKRFAFSSKTEPPKDLVSTTETDSRPQSLKSNDTPLKIHTKPRVGLTDKESTTLSLQVKLGEEVELVRLRHCDVTIEGTPSSVLFDHLEDCTVHCAPVMTAVFIDDTTRSTLYFACHQLRIHRTHSTTFYIHVGSSPIIENCTGCKFGPLKFTPDQLKESALDPEVNRYREIQDFNWLAGDKPSPNYEIVEGV